MKYLAIYVAGCVMTYFAMLHVDPPQADMTGMICMMWFGLVVGILIKAVMEDAF